MINDLGEWETAELEEEKAPKKPVSGRGRPASGRGKARGGERGKRGK